MATLTPQVVNPFTALAHTYAAASTADVFANDGNTFLLFKNSNASARTLTIAANDADKAGFGTIITPDTVITLNGSGTNGGETLVGRFPTQRFNNASDQVSYTIDAVTGLTVAVVKLSPVV